MFPLEFRGEINHEEARVMGLLFGKSCMILTSTIFDWSTRVTDGQTDGRARAYTRYSIYAVARKNLAFLSSFGFKCDTFGNLQWKLEGNSPVCSL